MKTSRIICLLALLVGFVSISATTQEVEKSSSIGIGALVTYHMPSMNAQGVLAPSAGFAASARYRLGGLPLYLGLSGSYSKSDAVNDDVSIQTIGAGAGAGLYLTPLRFLSIRAGGSVGYGYSTLTTSDLSGSQGALGWSGVIGFDVPLSGSISLTGEGALTSHVNTYTAFQAGFGIVWTPGGSGGSQRTGPSGTPRPQPLATVAEAEEVPEDDADSSVGELSIVMNETVDYTRADLQILNAGFSTVFPVFYRYYVENPVGSAVLKNDTRREITNIDVAVNIPRFMDLPQRQTVPDTIPPGEEIQIPLSILFNDDLLAVTEGTRVAAEITVTYDVKGEESSYSVNTILDVANRNAMTWDDDRKAASFVTAKDPAILTFAKSVAGIIRDGGRSVVSPNLRTAMAILEAMNLHGISYVIDPTTPYAELSDNSQAIDFLQFPAQTFQYQAGDCDDLSICYASNLESVGIPAAFITVPGHIFAAFNTGVPEDKIGSTFPRADEVIVHEGEAWIPVEVTILDKGFLEAWQIGARQWRENDSRDQAELIPIQEAWLAYDPVGFDTSERQTIPVPNEADLLRAYLHQLEEYVSDAIQPQVARLENRINSRGGSARDYNRVGVVYAKYEIIDSAREWFTKAIEEEPYAESYLNLGHLDYMEEDYADALGYYDEAYELEPENPVILLAEARAHHELENYGFAIKYYEEMATINQDLADQFEYLQFRGSDIGRASDVALMKSVIIWGEEEE